MTYTVTLPRSVVEQALSTLLMYGPSLVKYGLTFKHGKDAIDALRAALEQPQVEQDSQASAAYDMIDRYLRNSLHDDDYSEYSAALDSLYTHPQPPRQPLTDEQIGEIVALKEQRDELLEALINMVDYYGTASANVQQLDAAKSAIAKATGETK